MKTELSFENGAHFEREGLAKPGQRGLEKPGQAREGQKGQRGEPAALMTSDFRGRRGSPPLKDGSHPFPTLPRNRRNS